MGTEIILVLKDDTDTDNYSEYLEEYTLANLVKKYSDYIRFPITMFREKSRQKPKPEDAGDDYKPEYETYTELETLNSMVPIWKRPKSEVKDEDYNEFYKSKFMDYTDRCGSSPAGPRALPPTRRCSLSPAPPPTTTTPRSTRRVWPVCLRRYDHGEVRRSAA